MGWPNYFDAMKAPNADVITTGIRNPLTPTSRQLPPAYQREDAREAALVTDIYNTSPAAPGTAQETASQGALSEQQTSELTQPDIPDITSSLDMDSIGAAAGKGALAGAAIGGAPGAVAGGIMGGYRSASLQALGLSGPYAEKGYNAGMIAGIAAPVPGLSFLTGPLGAYLADLYGDKTNQRNEEALRDAISSLHSSRVTAGRVFSATSKAADIFGRTATMEEALSAFADLFGFAEVEEQYTAAEAEYSASATETADTGYTSDYSAGPEWGGGGGADSSNPDGDSANEAGGGTGNEW